VPGNLADLIRTVREKRLDCGIGYDGDADRIGVVDEKGDILWGDQLLMIYAREILAKGPAAVVFEVKCSQNLARDVERHGGRPVMWKTGHSLIKEKMKAEHAAIAGEMSGHIFFADDYFGFDDAVYARCASCASSRPRASRSPRCSRTCRRPSRPPRSASTARTSASSRSSRRSPRSSPRAAR